MGKIKSASDGTYVGFLHKKLHIQGNHIRYWIEHVPEFLAFIKDGMNAGATFTDEVVFQKMQDLFLQHENEQTFSRNAAGYALSDLAEYLYGDANKWNGFDRTNYRPIRLPEEFESMIGLLEVLSPLDTHSQRSILYSPELMDLLKTNGYVTLEHVYNSFRHFFYPMRKEDSGYYKFRRVAQDFSMVLHGDPDWWTRDYEEHKPPLHTKSE